MTRWVKGSKRKPVDVGMYLVAGRRYYTGDECIFVPIVGAAWWNGRKFYFLKQATEFRIKQWKRLPAPPKGLEDT